MKKKVFELDVEDFVFLSGLIKKSKEVKRALILVLLHKGFKNAEIGEILDINPDTVTRIKRRYLEEGVESAVNDKPRPGQPRKYRNKEEAEIIALSYTDPPTGRKQWTVRLLAETLQKREGFESINRETVRLVLKKAKQNPGQKECGA